MLLALIPLLLNVPDCDELRPLVYRIALYNAANERAGFGAGFFLDEKGTFVTARHVLTDSHGGRHAVVEMRDGADAPVTSVLASSRTLDVVILHVAIGAARVRVLKPAAEIHSGEKVFGFRTGPPLPKQFGPLTGIACTSGEVVAVTPAEISVRGEHFFVNGSSGSPVLTARGEVAGVALEMVNWNPDSGKPDWTYTALPMARVLALRRFATPLPLTEYLRREALDESSIKAPGLEVGVGHDALVQGNRGVNPLHDEHP